jgi:DNA-binding transcriptional LysR family regulator
MDIEPNDLLLFARIAESGSFSRAAQRTGLPKSTLSRRISALERRLGERLLLRTTRKLTVTEFGLGLLDHARGVVEETEAAAALVQHRQAEPSGRLRISMPSDFANLALGKLLADFMARFPAISLELDLSPRRVDLVGEGFDLAIRMGDLPDDATLVARRIVLFSGGLYASPAYTARQGVPESPDDLAAHHTLGLLGAGGAATWRLARGKAVWEGVPSAQATANSPELLVRLACMGAGIAAVPDISALPYVGSGELVRVLPEWSLPPAAGWAVFPGRRLMPAKTRVFLEMLEASLAG